MAPRREPASGKRPTPAEQADAFKAAQEQMKQDAAKRRADAEAAEARGDKKSRRR
jgi:hypothetical protein